MQSVKQFFTDGAQKTVEAIVMIQQEGHNYYCKICELKLMMTMMKVSITAYVWDGCILNEQD